MKKIFLTVLAAAALCACSNKEQLPQSVNPAAGTAVRFETRTYTLKSSDTGLDNGDKVGIFALAPINRQNVEATVAGTALEIAAENTIYWGKDQTEETQFIAYYPYAEGLALNTPVPFAVKADQSTAANYQASDLMGGGAKSAPKTEAVVFELEHKLSKVVVKVDNKVATETVASVSLDKMILDATLTIGEDDFAIGTTEGIQKAFRPDAAKDEFELIVIPQSAQPKLVVTMVSGKTYTFSLAAAATFKPGKKATAEVEITAAEPSASPASFSFSVKNWEDDTDALAFDNPVEGTSWVKEDNKWAVIGLNGDWEHDVYMTQGVDGGGLEEWSVTITYDPAKTEKIKLRYNNDFADGDFGASNSDPSVTIVPLNVKTDYNLVAGGADFSINVTAATEVSIYFRPSDGHLWLQADVTSGGGDPVDPTAKADLYVINGPAWDAPVVWAWGASVVMPGDWPNGLAPVGVENIGGKDYVHFELDSSYIGTIGFLIVNNQALPAPQTVNADDVIVKNGDKLYYEVGTVADGTGKYPLTPVL